MVVLNFCSLTLMLTSKAVHRLLNSSHFLPHCACTAHRPPSCLYHSYNMPSKTNLGVAIDGNGVLIPIADAVPLLGASVKGSLEALQKILQYNEVCPSRQTCLKILSEGNDSK
jgi:hypothetical protein